MALTRSDTHTDTPPWKRPRVEGEEVHPRDARIVFEPEGHKYFVDGVPVDISVTGLWVQYFPRFEAEETIERSFNMWKTQVHSKYYNLLQYLELVEGLDDLAQKKAIAALWEANGANAAAKGTRMHVQIEAFLKGKETESEAVSPEMEQFHEWRSEWAGDLSVYRTEWAIFDEAAKVAGMIDSVWKDEKGRLIIVDWKRCKPNGKKGLSPEDPSYGRKGLVHCDTLPDNKYSHYSVQLNLYKRILERCYGLTVHAMYLAQFHPDLKKYHCVEVPALVEMADKILTGRKE